MKKKYLTLLEVFIGLGLTALLLTALFSNFSQIVKTNIKVQKAKGETHWTFVTQMRLAQVFETVDENSDFYAKEGILSFSFHNGIDPEGAFSQEVSGTLQLDPQKEFCLQIRGEEGKERKEVFVKQVDTFSLLFFDPTKKKWVSTWNKEDPLPPLIRIVVLKKEFNFILPKANRRAVYP